MKNIKSFPKNLLIPDLIQVIFFTYAGKTWKSIIMKLGYQLCTRFLLLQVPTKSVTYILGLRIITVCGLKGKVALWYITDSIRRVRCLVTAQRHAPAALPLWKSPGTNGTGGWVGPRASLNGVCKKPAPIGVRTPDVQPVASRYTDCCF
jgi:hypothetical protein